MNNYKLIITYDGSNYNGYQRQGNSTKTIEETITNVLQDYLSEKIELISSGRTDKGVHAVGQVANFKTKRNIDIESFLYHVNTKLYNDIYIKKIEKVDEKFHSRYNAKNKTYMFKISKKYSPFTRKFSYFYSKELNVAKMKEASEKLLGTHDFIGFSSLNKSKKSTERTIHSIKFEETPTELLIYINGDGFLYNMVRILIGTLLEISEGTRDINSIDMVFDKKDRALGGKTIPPHGLYLLSVEY